MSDPLSELRTAHAAVADALDAFPAGALTASPSDDEWSPADVLEHLVKTENGMLILVTRQLAAAEDRRDLGPRRPGAFDQLRAYLQSDRRIAVPESSARFVSPSGADPAMLRARWDALPDLWAEQLALVPSVLADEGLVPHPIAGPLTVAETAGFVADHARHHLFQLRRLRGALGSA